MMSVSCGKAVRVWKNEWLTASSGPRKTRTFSVGRFGNMRQLLAVLAVVLGALSSAPQAQAMICPFCSAVSQTFSEEMASMDVVVFAELVKAAAPPADIRDASTVTRAEFKIVEVLKGAEFAQVGGTIATIYLGDAKPGDRFMVQGVRPPDIAWSTPMRVSEKAMRYLVSLESVPDQGPERLKFFVNHLEDEDEMLARDSYDEFARAPYEDVIAIKDTIDRDKLLGWLLDVEVSASRKRLYYTLLGVCGNTEDLPTLERLMRSTDRQEKAGLDALIACYLTIRGNEGLPLIEELFLGNHEADYSDTYSAITALRFHGTDGNVIDREMIVKSLELMLDRPALADLVIPDLARWEDWSVMDRLVEMFKTADEKTSWIRVPVVNYLRACPLPEAKAHLDELAKLDPDAIRRANTFFPVIDEEDLDDESEDNTDNETPEPTPAEGDGGGMSASTKSLKIPAAETALADASSSLSLGALAVSDPRMLLVALPSAAPATELPVAPPAATATVPAPPATIVASDSNLRPGSGVTILGAWSDSPRFVAAQNAPNSQGLPYRNPTVLAKANNDFVSWAWVGMLSLACLALAVFTQWYVLTGQLAKVVN